VRPVRDIVTVTDPRLVNVLAYGDAANYLCAFVDAPTTVSEAATHLDLPLQRVHHWARRLVDLGALTVVGRRPRQGRPMTLYRSVARRFRIPAAVVPEGQYERLSAELDRRTRRAVAAAAPELAVDGDLVLTLLADGTSIDRMPAGIADPPPSERGDWIPSDLVTTWRTLELTESEAETLAAELWALADRYSDLGRQRSGERTAARWLRIDLVRGL